MRDFQILLVITLGRYSSLLVLSRMSYYLHVIMYFQNGKERKKETAGQDTFQINKQSSNEASNYTLDKVKRKGPDFSVFVTEANHSVLKTSTASKNALMEIKASNAVAFHIPTEQSVCRPPPKRFCDQVKLERENISIERLTEKQKMAEKRKKVSYFQLTLNTCTYYKYKTIKLIIKL